MTDWYSTAMRRVIVMLLACVLMLSHGGMGEAAPHANGEHHANTVHVEHTDTADHHLTPTSPERDGGMDHASHVHVVGDLVAPQTASVPPFPVSGSVVRMKSDAVLHSRGVAPLLEPPAA